MSSEYTLTEGPEAEAKRLRNDRTRDLERLGFTFAGLLAFRAGEAGWTYSVFLDRDRTRIALVSEVDSFGRYTGLTFYDFLDDGFAVSSEVVPWPLRFISLLGFRFETEHRSSAIASLGTSTDEHLARHEARVAQTARKRSRSRAGLTLQTFLAYKRDEGKRSSADLSNFFRKGLVVGVIVAVLAVVFRATGGKLQTQLPTRIDGESVEWIVLSIATVLVVFFVPFGRVFEKMRLAAPPKPPPTPWADAPEVLVSSTAEELTLTAPRHPRVMLGVRVLSTLCGLVFFVPLATQGIGWFKSNIGLGVFALQWVFGLKDLFERTAGTKSLGAATVTAEGVLAGGVLVPRTSLAAAALRSAPSGKGALHLLDRRGDEIARLEGDHASLERAREVLQLSSNGSSVVLATKFPLPALVRRGLPVLGLIPLVFDDVAGVIASPLLCLGLAWLASGAFGRASVGADGLLVGRRFVPWSRIVVASSKDKGRVVELVVEGKVVPEVFAFRHAGSADIVLEAWNDASARARVDTVLAARLATEGLTAGYRHVDVSDTDLANLVEDGRERRSLRLRAAEALSKRASSSGVRLVAAERVVDPEVRRKVSGGRST